MKMQSKRSSSINFFICNNFSMNVFTSECVLTHFWPRILTTTKMTSFPVGCLKHKSLTKEIKLFRPQTCLFIIIIVILNDKINIQNTEKVVWFIEKFKLSCHYYSFFKTHPYILTKKLRVQCVCQLSVSKTLLIILCISFLYNVDNTCIRGYFLLFMGGKKEN